MKTKLINISTGLQKSLKIAADTLMSDGIIIFPTETVYGIGCRITDLNAMVDIFTIKNRSYRKPLSAYINSLDQVHQIAINITDSYSKLAEAFLPGPLAIILEAKQDLPEYVTDGAETISIRYPDNEFVLELIDRVGLLAGTSANVSGEASGRIFTETILPFIGKIGAAFQDDEHIGGIESTIISLTGNIPKILRPGAIKTELIEEVLGLKFNK
jgi:L-threonylcarbamoyladenylate synthase